MGTKHGIYQIEKGNWGTEIHVAGHLACIYARGNVYPAYLPTLPTGAAKVSIPPEKKSEASHLSFSSSSAVTVVL